VPPVDVSLLRDRFLSRFLQAWPDRDLPEDFIRSTLELRLSSEDDGPVVVVRLLGYTTSVGFDGSHEGAVETVDEIAEHLAENAEGDRWTDRDGWREYRGDG
jgi:hypothetical protein